MAEDPHNPALPLPTCLCCSAEGALSRRQILDLDIATGGDLSLSQRGPSSVTGAGNYWLDVHAPHPPGGGGGSTDVAARVWLLDSMDRYCPPVMFGW